jgi:hypothetical protein
MEKACNLPKLSASLRPQVHFGCDGSPKVQSACTPFTSMLRVVRPAAAAICTANYLTLRLRAFLFPGLIVTPSILSRMPVAR